MFLLREGVQGEVEAEGPSESECRPYIEKALKELEAGEAGEAAVGSSAEQGDSKEDIPTVEITDDSDHHEGDGEKDDANEDGQDSKENDISSEKKIEPEVRHGFLQKVTSFFQKIFQKTPRKKEEAANESKRSEEKVYPITDWVFHTIDSNTFSISNLSQSNILLYNIIKLLINIIHVSFLTAQLCWRKDC